MKTILSAVENSFDIEKSVFTTYAFPVQNVEQLNKQLDEIRKQHLKSTHICYAVVMSSPQVEKAVDDGEPQGTAGRPMLEVLKKQKLTDVAVVVVRYFGGIKLGRGGLLRAYVKSTAECLKLCKMVEK